MSTNKQRIEECIKCKMEGNRLFKSGKFNDAILQYENALTLIADLDSSISQKMELFIALNNNLSLIYIKLKQWNKSILFATNVLNVQQYNLKALMRRGQSYCYNNLLFVAAKDLIAAAAIAPTNSVVKTLLEMTFTKQVEANAKMFETNINNQTFIGVDPRKKFVVTYCYGCFKIEQRYCSFQRCVNCQLATFCSVKCATECSQYHNFTCRPFNEKKSENNVIRKMSADECCKILKFQHRSNDFNGKTSVLIRRLIYILDNRIDPNMSSADIGSELHGIARMYCRSPNISVHIFRALLSAPGMLDLLLNIPMISLERLNLYNCYGRPPTLNPDTMNEEYERIYDELNSRSSASAVSEFGYYVFNILLRVITSESELDLNQIMASSDFDGRKSKIRESDKRGGLFKVCVERVLELYCNIHVFQDCGASMSWLYSGASMSWLSNVICKLLPLIKNKEILIGITWDELIYGTSLLDTAVYELIHGFQKLGPYNVLLYTLKQIESDDVWKCRNNRTVTYLILLLSYCLEQISDDSFADFEYMYDSFDETHIQLLSNQIKKSMTSIINGCNISSKQLIKMILFYHCQKETDVSVLSRAGLYSMPPAYSFVWRGEQKSFWYYMYSYCNISQLNVDMIQETKQKWNGMQFRFDNIKQWNIVKKCLKSGMRTSKYKEHKSYMKLMFNKAKKCGNCTARNSKFAKLKICSRCKKSYYCNRHCQKISWKYK
eukprot:283335_1